MDSCGGCIEGELADRDAHAPCALVTDAENALVVGRDDHRPLSHGAAAQSPRHASPFPRSDVDAAGPAEDLAPVLTGQGDRRGVDDGDDVLEVLDDEPVKKRLVTILEAVEIDVLLQFRFLVIELVTGPQQMLFYGRHVVGQEAVQGEGVALLPSERRAFVEKRRLEQVLAP